MGILSRTGDTGRPAAAPGALAGALIAELAAARTSLESLFRGSVLYLESDERAVPLVHQDRDGSRWWRAYTALDLVPGVALGQDVEHVAWRGAVLLDRRPDGVGIVVDRGQEHAAVIVPAGAAGVPDPRAAEVRDGDTDTGAAS